MDPLEWREWIENNHRFLRPFTSEPRHARNRKVRMAPQTNPEANEIEQTVVRFGEDWAGYLLLRI